jgi:hypothetical protein
MKNDNVAYNVSDKKSAFSNSIKHRDKNEVACYLRSGTSRIIKLGAKRKIGEGLEKYCDGVKAKAPKSRPRPRP